MAQLLKDDEILVKWATGKAARKLKPPYPTVVLHASELKFVGPWEWIMVEDPTCPGVLIPAAKTIGGCSITVHGEYAPEKLRDGRYNVFFLVEVTHQVHEKFRVELELIRPNGTTEVIIEDLNKKPKNVPIGLKVGEFNNTPFKLCDIEFSLKSADGSTLKDGLIVIGAAIVHAGPALPEPEPRTVPPINE